MSVASVWPSVPVQGEVSDRSAPPPPDAGLSLHVRLEIARELTGALDQATAAGQSHIMGRVVGILRGAVLWPEPRATTLGRSAATAMLDVLEWEAERVAPDARAFRERAVRLVDLVEGVGR